MKNFAVPGLLLALVSVLQAGYSLSPMITVLEPSGNKSSAVVTLKFEGDVKAPVALELKIMGREITPEGKVVFTEDRSADNFVLYPAQVILMPGDNQRVQVQWVGDSTPLKELVFGLIAQQAPIKLDDDNRVRNTPQGMVQVLTKYEAIVVVRPSGTRPLAQVDAAEQKAGNDGKPLLVLTLSNAGTALQKLDGMRLSVSPMNKSGQLSASRTLIYKPVLTDLQKKHSLFAGYRRKLELPWPDGVPLGPVRVTVDFSETR